MYIMRVSTLNTFIISYVSFTKLRLHSVSFTKDFYRCKLLWKLLWRFFGIHTYLYNQCLMSRTKCYLLTASIQNILLKMCMEYVCPAVFLMLTDNNTICCDIWHNSIINSLVIWRWIYLWVIRYKKRENSSF